MKDATGSISVSVWQDVLAGLLKISEEEIWKLYEACDPDTACDPDYAAQQFAEALNVICNEEKVFIVKCTEWKANKQFALLRVSDSL